MCAFVSKNKREKYHLLTPSAMLVAAKQRKILCLVPTIERGTILLSNANLSSVLRPTRFTKAKTLWIMSIAIEG